MPITIITNWHKVIFYRTEANKNVDTGTISVSKNKLTVIYGLLGVYPQLRIKTNLVQLISYLPTVMIKRIWQKGHSTGVNSFLLLFSVIIFKKLRKLIC